MRLTQHSDALKFKAAYRLVHKNILKARWDLLYFMELPGGPDEDRPKTLGPKKTAAIVATELDANEERLKKRKQSTSNSSLTKNSEDNDYEEDEEDNDIDQEDEPPLSDIGSGVTNYEKSNSSKRSKLVTAVMKTFPAIESGIFTIIDEMDGKLYIGTEEFNKECADMFRCNPNHRVLHLN